VIGRLILSALLLAGCATTPTLIDRANTLKPGVSTLQDAVALLGQPTSVTDYGKAKGYVWQQKSQGLADFKIDTVGIAFTPDGKMIKLVHQAKTN
jgi:uncharacterized lipoprotein YmbA